MYLKPPAGMGFDFSEMLSTMGKNVVNSLVDKLPGIAVTTLAAVAVAKISDQLAPASGGSASKPAATPEEKAAKEAAAEAKAAAKAAKAAPGGAQAAPGATEPAGAAPTTPVSAKAALPGWVLPVGLGVGALALVAIVPPLLRGRK